MCYVINSGEENDIDIKLGSGTLYDHIEGLEKVQLEASLQYYDEHGMDKRPILKRLAEIEVEEENKRQEAERIQAEEVKAVKDAIANRDVIAA